MWHHRDLVLRITANPAKLMFLEGWSDTDWAGCPETLKSTGCAVIYWADALIHMHSRTQSYNALSSSEAEYGGAVSCAAMMIFLASMLSFLGFKVQKRMYLDASSAIAIAKFKELGKWKI